MTTRVGTRNLASYAAKLAKRRKWSQQDQRYWEKLGTGSFRVVLLHKPSEVVYKVERPTVPRAWGGTRAEWERYIAKGYGNRGELKNARRLRKLTWEYCHIPAVSGYTIDGQVIIAMEWIPYITLEAFDQETDAVALSTELQAALRELRDKARLADLHGENLMVLPGLKLAPIDMGSHRLPPGRAGSLACFLNTGTFDPLEGASDYE